MSQVREYLKKIKHIGFPNEEVSWEIVHININRLFYLSIISILVRILTIISFLSKDYSSNQNTSNWAKGIVISHFLLLLFHIVTNLASGRLRKTRKHGKMMLFLQYFAVFIILLSGLLITLIDQMVTSNISPFIISYILIGVIFLIRPIYSVLFYLLFYVLFYFGIAYMNIDPTIIQSNRINGLTITTLGILLSLILWQSNVVNISQKNTIKNQQKELVKKNKELEILSSRDPLTGLANRRTIEEDLNQLLELKNIGEGACFLMMDLNDFKSINDKYGHPVGDRTLREFADFLKKEVRSTDIVARLGGDEFAILLFNTNLENGKLISEKILKSLENKKFDLEGGPLSLRVGIGIAFIDKNMANFDEVYKLADKDLYRNKYGLEKA